MSLIFSDAFGDRILDCFFGGATLSVPSDWELSLWNGNPFTSGTEISTAGGYGRQTVTNNGLTFDEANAGNGGFAVANQISIAFPSSGTASADWQSANYLAFSEVVADPPVMAMKLPETVTVLNGGNVVFPIGSLKLELASESGGGGLIGETWALALLKRVLGGGAAGGPATWYAGLWLGNPFTGGVEVTTTGTGYSRRSFTNNGAAWNTATVTGKRAVSKATALRWPATGDAGADFGQVLYIGLAEGSSSAPVLALPLPGSGRNVKTGGFLGVPADGLIITLFSQDA